MVILLHGETRMWSNPEWYKFILDHFHTSSQFGVRGAIAGKRLLPVSPCGGFSGRKLWVRGFFLDLIEMAVWSVHGAQS
jgi:hypothetical protein